MIYATIAILFGSYTQPIIIMAAIPGALVGAVLGHALLGFSLTFLSVIGAVALSGIVVNDSLILVDRVNKLREKGVDLIDAVIQGARSRLRPILLTSITTCGGLAPIMLETSFQARFLPGLGGVVANANARDPGGRNLDPFQLLVQVWFFSP